MKEQDSRLDTIIISDGIGYIIIICKGARVGE